MKQSRDISVDDVKYIEFTGRLLIIALIFASFSAVLTILLKLNILTNFLLFLWPPNYVLMSTMSTQYLKYSGSYVVTINSTFSLVLFVWFLVSYYFRLFYRTEMYSGRIVRILAIVSIGSFLAPCTGFSAVGGMFSFSENHFLWFTVAKGLLFVIGFYVCIFLLFYFLLNGIRLKSMGGR